MAYDVITSGSAVWDVFVETGLPEKKGCITYPAGSKIIVKDLSFHEGGSGVNTSVSLSRLGLRTAFLSNVGVDYHGKLILELLKKEKVDFLGKISKALTGYSVILDSKEHNRTILTYKGANSLIKFPQIPLNKIKTKWIYFSSMAYESFNVHEKLAKWAVKKGIKIAWNPSSYQISLGLKRLRPFLKNVTLLILNKEEASKLIKKRNLHKELHKLGPKIVCITEGKKGNTTYDGTHLYIAKASPLKALERTGAGDAFSSGFLAGLIKTDSIESAICLGSANAESVICVKGAMNGLLTKAQAVKVLKKKPFKIEKKIY